MSDYPWIDPEERLPRIGQRVKFIDWMGLALAALLCCAAGLHRHLFRLAGRDMGHGTHGAYQA